MVRIVNASVTPPTVAIKPKGIMPSEAIVQLGVVDDSGHGVAAADVLLVVDNGLISKDRETWGPTLSVKTDEHGSAYAWFDAKFEAVVRPGSAKIVAIIGPSTKPDDVISKDISIIGPPASVLVSAAPLDCSRARSSPSKPLLKTQSVKRFPTVLKSSSRRHRRADRRDS
jgi:hypothetical protein